MFICPQNFHWTLKLRPLLTKTMQCYLIFKLNTVQSNMITKLECFSSPCHTAPDQLGLAWLLPVWMILLCSTWKRLLLFFLEIPTLPHPPRIFWPACLSNFPKKFSWKFRPPPLPLNKHLRITKDMWSLPFDTNHTTANCKCKVIFISMSFKFF